jgi:ubiquinone/menaquinone biosynthesis C-methylase UbiE
MFLLLFSPRTWSIQKNAKKRIWFTQGTLASFGEGKNIYGFFRDSVHDFPQPEEFAMMLNKAGFEVETVTNYAYGVVQHYQAVKKESAEGRD